MAHSPAASTAIYSQNVAPSYVRLEINVLTRGRIGSQGHELEFWLQERLLYRDNMVATTKGPLSEREKEFGSLDFNNFNQNIKKKFEL